MPAAAGFTVELRSYAWPQPNELIFEEPEPILGLSIGHLPAGESRPRLSGPRARFRKLGRLIFTPARIPFDVRGKGGSSVVAACTFAPEVFARLTEGVEWGEARLAACGDIHGTSIDAALMRLTREAAAPDCASDVMLEAAGTMIAVELVRFLQAPAPQDRPTRRFSAQQLALIEAMIEGEEAVTLDTIAARCAMSVRTLTRVFKATTGRTIGEAVADARMRRAAALLKEGSAPLKVIAHRAGFTSAGSFVAAFRRATGVTPGTFRRDHSATA